MVERTLGLALLLVAAVMPCFTSQPLNEPFDPAAFPGFPAAFSELRELPLSEGERAFLRNFPGKVAKFARADTQYIVRWIARPTRRLHPAEDCFRASGHVITHRAAGFLATRSGHRSLVSEQLLDRDGHTFRDVSAWYWAASRGTSIGPWWSITTVRPEP